MCCLVIIVQYRLLLQSLFSESLQRSNLINVWKENHLDGVLIIVVAELGSEANKYSTFRNVGFEVLFRKCLRLLLSKLMYPHQPTWPQPHLVGRSQISDLVLDQKFLNKNQSHQ